MKSGSVVIFESTVYPGTTEEVCVPIIEQASGFTWKKDFHVGYPPERINPWDKEHTLDKDYQGRFRRWFWKPGSAWKALWFNHLSRLYCVQNIKEAEAAKEIENIQRGLNIALINELSLIFDKLGIDTLYVLEAAGTKSNFLPFRPGLAGGHCIGVDPYYLTYKAQTNGYPEVILAGRKTNDNMGNLLPKKPLKSWSGKA